MARPRIFISSTFYDLKYVRADLEYFVKELGYEPILNERGTIPYGSGEKLEEYAYREVETCDILVSIIGGRFGTESSDAAYSISQAELRRALEGEKQVYIFIEQAVRAEYATYLLNADNQDVRYRVDDPRVFSFIQEVEQLQRNNPIASFESSRDITDYLREQWAGLFQRFLLEERSKVEGRKLAQIERTATTLDRVLSVLSVHEEDRGADGGRDPVKRADVDKLLLTNHPAFPRLQELLEVPYRVFFTTRDELKAWLLAAEDFSHEVKGENRDFPDYAEYFREAGANPETDFDLLHIYEELFDEQGNLKPIRPDEWDPDWIRLREARFAAVLGDAEKGGSE